jgi:ParB family transcriptional regulator, chromosome partitioning protein
MQPVISVNPFRCQMWPLHDRIESYITEGTCRAEIESFAKHGQLVPVLGRELKDDPNYDIELVYGARRLFVARYLNKPLAVEVRKMSDREALIAMDIENRQRVDISPYERGMSYASWLRSAHFQSQDDIARALKISASKVSRLLKLARLPAVVVDAFCSPAEICEGWGLDLMDALDDSQRRPAVLRKARELRAVEPRRDGRDVYRLLMTAPGLREKLKPRGRTEVVKDLRGNLLFRLRQQRSAIAIVVPTARMSAHALEQIRLSVARILQSDVPQLVELDRSREEPHKFGIRGPRDELKQSMPS